jgi:hypothetical protein
MITSHSGLDSIINLMLVLGESPPSLTESVLEHAHYRAWQHKLGNVKHYHYRDAYLTCIQCTLHDMARGHAWIRFPPAHKHPTTWLSVCSLFSRPQSGSCFHAYLLLHNPSFRPIPPIHQSRSSLQYIDSYGYNTI